MTDSEIRRPSMAEYFIRCITQKYCCFTGRASRKEFWHYLLILIGSLALGEFILTVYLLPIAVAFALQVNDAIKIESFVENLAGMILLIPTAAILVRRLRDAGIHPIILIFFALFIVCDFCAKSRIPYPMPCHSEWLLALLLIFLVLPSKKKIKANKNQSVSETTDA